MWGEETKRRACSSNVGGETPRGLSGPLIRAFFSRWRSRAPRACRSEEEGSLERCWPPDRPLRGGEEGDTEKGGGGGPGTGDDGQSPLGSRVLLRFCVSSSLGKSPCFLDPARVGTRTDVGGAEESGRAVGSRSPCHAPGTGKRCVCMWGGGHRPVDTAESFWGAQAVSPGRSPRLEAVTPVPPAAQGKPLSHRRRKDRRTVLSLITLLYFPSR